MSLINAWLCCSIYVWVRVLLLCIHIKCSKKNVLEISVRHVRLLVDIHVIMWWLLHDQSVRHWCQGFLYCWGSPLTLHHCQWQTSHEPADSKKCTNPLKHFKKIIPSGKKWLARVHTLNSLEWYTYLSNFSMWEFLGLQFSGECRGERGYWWKDTIFHTGTITNQCWIFMRHLRRNTACKKLILFRQVQIYQLVGRCK